MTRICVFGAGAIGSHLATRAALGGADVAVVARGPHLEAMRARGITLHAHDGVRTVRVQAFATAEEVGPVDAVLVTTKVPALPAAARAIAPLLGPDTPVAFVTNGIPWWYFLRHGGPREGERIPLLDPGAEIERSIGMHRTLGGVVYSASAVIEPGVVKSEHADIRLFLGEPDGSVTPRAQAIASAIEAGGMPCPVVTDIRHRVWGKLMGNLTSGPLCILSRADMMTTLSDPAIYAAAIAIAEEGAALALAHGHDLATSAEARMKRSAMIAHKPSILQDLELGRAMEIDALFTVPLDLAKQAGVPMPVFELTARLATQAARAAGLYAPAP
ncbi:ketopantoate reductase family protein [Roseomonas fluvialis]|uniref:2-dehydropantoate 2-reductase n=1 Tax=Roseomonas fluvialis TaxID=1750527 RepID=A0ABN6NYP4_9PROT|nr:2-dehydropantoate 2-reductase [Roseomonas fluvialis]BDG71437.1 2-dehydropantoate 2-reductase [Roseomonas fluvialis]